MTILVNVGTPPNVLPFVLPAKVKLFRTIGVGPVLMATEITCVCPAPGAVPANICSAVDVIAHVAQTAVLTLTVYMRLKLFVNEPAALWKVQPYV
jgi:hypothetical protein